MTVLLILAAILFLIGCIPVGLLFRYREQVELKLKIACFHFGILPPKPLSRKKREKREVKKAAKADKKAKKKKKQQAQSLIAKPAEQKEQTAEPPKPLKDKIAALIPWAKLAAGFVGRFFHRKLCVKHLRVRAVLAGSDPAKVAKSVGSAWETIGMTLPILEQVFRIKERKLAVYPDFTATKTELEAELFVQLRVGGVVLLVLKYACKALWLFLRQKGILRKKKAVGPAEAAG